MFLSRSHALIMSACLLMLVFRAIPTNAGHGYLQLSTAEQAFLDAKGELTIVCDPHWPPYEYRTRDGRYEGMSVDYHALFAKRIGIPIRYIPTTSWSESLELAQYGQCDLVSTLNKTPLRSQYLNFTAPFINAKVVIIGKTDSRLSSLEDCTGRTLAIVKGYKMEEDMARDYPSIRHHLVATTTESLRAVENGEADATIAAFFEAQHLIRVHEFKTLKVLGTTRYDNHHRIGVRKGDALLLSIMQKAVRSLSPKDKQLIENTWVTAREAPLPPLPPYAFPLFLASLVLLALLPWIANIRKAKRTPTP